MRIDDLTWADGRYHSLNKSVASRRSKLRTKGSALAVTCQGENLDEESSKAQNRKTLIASKAKKPQSSSSEDDDEPLTKRTLVTKSSVPNPKKNFKGKTLVATQRLETIDESRNQSDSASDNDGSDITVSHGDFSSDQENGITLLSAGFKPPECTFCKVGRHFLYGCPNFIKLDTAFRIQKVSELKRCFNCLSPSHKTADCKSKFTCKHCKKKHHSLLHKGKSVDR
jgi:hypothetical protein